VTPSWTYLVNRNTCIIQLSANHTHTHTKKNHKSRWLNFWLLYLIAEQANSCFCSVPEGFCHLVQQNSLNPQSPPLFFFFFFQKAATTGQPIYPITWNHFRSCWPASTPSTVTGKQSRIHHSQIPSRST